MSRVVLNKHKKIIEKAWLFIKYRTKELLIRIQFLSEEK